MIEREQRGAVSVITLNRPERRNAVSGEACVALADAVDAARYDGARAIVLTGTGPHFCAGADLSGVEDEHFAQQLRGALRSLHEAPIVTIAAVHGAALGAGMQLAVACDLRVVAPDARFGIPAAKLGLMVDHWTVQRVALLAGYGPARAVLLAADEIDAGAAVNLGLASRTGDLESAIAWAERIAELAPLTIAGHKVALNALEPTLDDPAVTDAFRRAWSSDDLREGRAAFAEKRAPRFQGR
ncbi:MAG TPA: enoyl-CoA hydratase [Acidimicrobiales bacterium]|nr:enoyl-CoA hydratase [Acidimicrobiales bacterium]